jgi:hypothetical protein
MVLATERPSECAILLIQVMGEETNFPVASNFAQALRSFNEVAPC